MVAKGEVAKGAKEKGRAAPRIDAEALTDTFRQQMESGRVSDAVISEERLPSLRLARLERCVLRSVSLSAPEAERLRLTDTRMEGSDLANANLTGGAFERVEFYETRLTGISLNEARLKSVLWRECKLDFALFRMARLEQCVFERCNLTEADFYGAALTGTVFRGCDLSRADLSQARLAGADIRDCRLDGMRGTPSSVEGLLINPDQAMLLITLFGVRVDL
jgi:uncharacterized protein YjbI with pentapeptide repeats